jgi:hypothetical protein
MSPLYQAVKGLHDVPLSEPIVHDVAMQFKCRWVTDDLWRYPRPSILNRPYELINFAPCLLSSAAISRRLSPNFSEMAITISPVRSASA